MSEFTKLHSLKAVNFVVCKLYHDKAAKNGKPTPASMLTSGSPADPTPHADDTVLVSDTLQALWGGGVSAL